MPRNFLSFLGAGEAVVISLLWSGPGPSLGLGRFREWTVTTTSAPATCWTWINSGGNLRNEIAQFIDPYARRMIDLRARRPEKRKALPRERGRASGAATLERRLADGPGVVAGQQLLQVSRALLRLRLVDH